MFVQVRQGLDWKEGPFQNEEMQTGTFNQGSGDKTERIEASSFLFQTVVYFLLPQPPRKQELLSHPSDIKRTKCLIIDSAFLRSEPMRQRNRV